ncbi:hypothetical protein [Cohnella sp. GCM10027633]|uniref:hypothetical protein n=1 Tax=unclassified Cohnella TaxID=2636738 RepID=UPI0036276C53
MLHVPKVRKAVVYSLCFLLMLSITLMNNVKPSMAATTTAKAPAKISLGNAATVQVKSADVFSQDKGTYLIYTLTYTNNGSNTVQLGDYWSKVKNTSGKTYTTSVIEKDKKITTLNAKSSVDVTYYVSVDESTLLSKLIITIVKWDFSAPSYTRTLGSFKLANYNTIPVAAFQPKYLTAKEWKIKTAIKSVKSKLASASTENDVDLRTLEISFLFENQNTREYKPSSTQFFLIAKDGSLFKVNSDSLKDLIVQPKERKIVTIKVKMPAIVKEDGLKLVMGTASETEGLFIPLATYQVPKSSTSTTTTAVSKLTYNDYEIEIIGYSRLPAGAQDTLTAMFKVTNKAKTAVKVPDLKASWTLNGIDQNNSEGKAVAYDQRVQLTTNQSILMLASIQVPYTATLDDIRVNLKEVEDAQTTNTIGQFKNLNVNKFIAAADQIAQFDRLAAKASIEVLRVRSSVEGKQLNVSGDLAITNLEPRVNNLQKYAIYLRDKDGQMYTLTLGEYTKPILANGRILVPFSGKVPLTTSTADMNLVIADLVQQQAEGGTAAGSLIGNAISMTTPWPATTVQDKFTNLTIGQNLISMDKFYAYAEYAGSMGSALGLNLELEYSLLKDATFDDVAGPYKLRIEIEDQQADKTVLSKEINLDDAEQGFKEGQNIKKIILLEDNKLLDKITEFRNYKLSIYCVVNDQKVLLAQRVMPYFLINWLVNQ